jgi:hypothetical protein
MRPGPFTRQAPHVGRVFRPQLRSNVFFGNSRFGEDEPIAEEELPFEERVELPSEEQAEELTEELIGERVFLPYPVCGAPYYPDYQVVEQTPATPTDRDSELARAVGRLRYEVERLRDEQVSHEPARQAELQPRRSVEEKTPTTILVFRDGRRSEVQNYAIVGQTLWLFTEQRARKMPVFDLDVEATKNVNDDRGVEFRVP